MEQDYKNSNESRIEPFKMPWWKWPNPTGPVPELFTVYGVFNRLLSTYSEQIVVVKSPQ
jgi:hypothetical protein